MVEALGLQSVVLQTTAFRLIARTLWDLGESKALRAFEELHHIDQEMYYRAGWRRNREVRYQFTYQPHADIWLMARRRSLSVISIIITLSRGGHKQPRIRKPILRSLGRYCNILGRCHKVQ